jgi:sugar/nucleoside kinase (ribokinase family)
VHTRGAEGAEIICGDTQAFQPIPAAEAIVDTTGAGDGFIAGFLTGICRLAREQGVDPSAGAGALLPWIQGLSTEDWEKLLRLGCFVGTRVCEDYGATPSLPLASDVPWQQLGFTH